MAPFHLAFHVKDLASTRRFYRDVLGCAEGRSTDIWVDFDFFGNQISAHLGPVAETADRGQVDGVAVPMPHFGAILDWSLLPEVARALEASGCTVVLPYQVRYPGQVGEQATVFVRDFSGNAIELKAFKNPDEIYAR
jgi:extradiol dioxygenase family protein